jgi:thioredoxin-like negative regulator of GroEL
MEMAPIVDGLKVEFAGRASVLQLNAGQSENEELQTQWGLRGHPSFAVLDADGQVIERFFGPQSVSRLRIAVQTVASSQYRAN